MAKASGDWVVPVVLGAGALGAFYLWTRKPGKNAPGMEPQAGGGGAPSESPFGGTESAFSFFDPATGLPVSPADVGFSSVVGPDGLLRDVTGHDVAPGPSEPTVFQPQFSPDFEREILRQNDETNRQIVAEQQRQTRNSNLETAAVVGGTAVFALPAAIKVASKTASLIRPAAPVIARAAGTAVRVAGPVGAGIGLGLAGVSALDKTGALDKVQQFGASTIGKAPAPVQTAVKTVALPLSTVGAVATGLVGRGTVQENVRTAFRGTVLDSGIKQVQSFFGWRR